MRNFFYHLEDFWNNPICFFRGHTPSLTGETEISFSYQCDRCGMLECRFKNPVVIPPGESRMISADFIAIDGPRKQESN